ncbi:M15 family metallopeptidase [Cellulomonas pakistanensis]|uniref:M15 family metallopeptidase n=1 Tax=Cellulomonas pakistanensis TaxID=992287 RepID=UPI00194484CB|nr:M15 family metallopeptidase [Cellulomonas pakistanensis]
MTSSTPSPRTSPDTTTPVDHAPVRARGRRAAGPAQDGPGDLPARRASAPSGRRAAAAGGRRAAEPTGGRVSHRADGRASVRTPARGVPVATLASADAPNRAERRRRRAPRRSAARMAQGAVAVGLALGVGGFAIAPTAVGARALAGADAEPTASPSPGDAATTAALAPEVVQERGAAVVLAATTVQEAGDAKADAVAAAVPADATAALDTAVAELDTLIAATQAEQPALQALQPAAPAAPVLSGEALDRAVAEVGASALADAAAAAGAESASDDVAAADPSAAPTEPTGSAADVAETPDDPTAARLTAAMGEVATLTAELQVVTQQAQEAQAAAAAAAAAAAEAARKEAQRTSLEGYSNGQIPSSALCGLDFAPGQELRCDAAEALEQLNVAFTQAFGTNLVITDSYRSYSQQVACRAQKGSLCATPGTSNHGGGVAIDLGGNAYSFGTDQHDWMLAHAEEYGWTLPEWARATGSKPEPWHWEYVG